MPEAPAPKIPNDQLDSLVAPIALYPDPLLSQTLVASTYPLEIVQLQQWMGKNEDLKGKALADAAEKQPWDPSIQSMVVVPDVVKQLGDNIAWTSQLGDAFLSQESDVMNAVQRMRTKAESAGTLKTSEQQTVETQQVDGKSVVVIQPSNPDVVYVPSYNPTVVYGQPAYPYPSMYYPPIAMWHGIATEVGASGAPLLVGALGWLECSIRDEVAAGTHTFFVCDVRRSECWRGRASARSCPGRLRDTVIEAVIFDLDGVLIDSEHVWDEVREELARERGGRWSDRAQADMMGMSSTEWSNYMHDVVGLAESPEEINAEVVRRMEGRYSDHLPLIEGAVVAVGGSWHFRLGLASSSNRPLIDVVLTNAGLA